MLGGWLRDQEHDESRVEMFSKKCRQSQAPATGLSTFRHDPSTAGECLRIAFGEKFKPAALDFRESFCVKNLSRRRLALRVLA